MSESVEETMTIDTDALIHEAVSTTENVTSTETEVTSGEPTNIVSKAFTAVEGENTEVEYVTMTPEEAAAAGVEEEEQVVTTSLQFDPANPSVLYTADGTLINQSDLSPEEQALVQAALQQHLAEQEAEQQLAMIDQGAGGATELIENSSASATEESTLIATSDGQAIETSVGITQDTSVLQHDAQLVTSAEVSTSEPVAVITPATVSSLTSTSVNLASPSTNASQIVQTLADNVRRQQEYLKAQTLLNRVKNQSAGKSESSEGYRFEEKIVIRQGQPQVVKMPVKSTPPRRPEIPAALANLMPKIEIGKDGSQVIRIHQSQISADQLKSLQENPNVRLVFRPANSSRGRSTAAGGRDNYPKKRGRPRKTYPTAPAASHSIQNDDESPPSKTSRYGRQTKLPYYQKDYLSSGLENGEAENDAAPTTSESYIKSINRVFQPVPGRRGRPPGSVNTNKAYRRSSSYAKKIEQLREQEFQHDEELTNARLSIVPQKPVLSSVELAISTRRKNRLRELLTACSEEEIMEVALPHLARVFSLWEFLVMKVEKNKLSKVYFADVYKEYEVLHRYVSRLTEKYKEVLTQTKGEQQKELGENSAEQTEDPEKDMEQEKRSFLKVRCKKLAQSLGLEQDELEDAFITLLDSQEVPSSQKNTESKVSEADQPTTNGNHISAEADSSIAPPLVIADDATTEQPEMPTLAPILNEAALSEAATQPNPEATAFSNEQNALVNPTEQMEVEEGKMDKSDEASTAAASVGGEQMATEAATAVEEGNVESGGTQIIQIGTGDDKQFIEVPEGYTLIQTPEGLVMSQPGTTLSQAEDGTIYVTQEDGTTAPLDAQKGVPMETVESLLSLEGQQSQ